MRNLFATESDYTLTIARLTLGVVFFAHGAQKLLGCFGGYGYTGTMGFFVQQLGIPMPLAFLAICAEFFGGLGLIVGVFGRVAALGISVNMLVAIARIHRHLGSSPTGPEPRRAKDMSSTCSQLL